MSKIFVGDTGTQLDVDTKTDLTLAESVVLTFLRPDGTTIEKSAIILDPKTSGIVRYTVESGFLSQAGVWRVSSLVTFPNSDKYYGDTDKFIVYNRYKDVV